ncbi:hypothetical protein [Bifidobacterium stellenboschense]|uniref:Uncharacterized protein n=1 Tax=Bifidobacterium stellenboschense TaxID=762211 RepID=A0A087DMY7_9BIFI|nr:hypothetical protein [Bifidobacterium stellenboschense]KFI96887.1 hypothetical protein BSTEL_1796 [Bifidobacterium stellenboschense]
MTDDSKNRRKAARLLDRVQSLELLTGFEALALTVWLDMLRGGRKEFNDMKPEYDKAKNLNKTLDVVYDCLKRFDTTLKWRTQGQPPLWREIGAVFDDISMSALQPTGEDEEPETHTLRESATLSFVDIYHDFMLAWWKGEWRPTGDGSTYLISGEIIDTRERSRFIYFRDRIIEGVEETDSKAVMSMLARCAYATGYTFKRYDQAKRHGETPTPDMVKGWRTVAATHANHAEEYKVQNMKGHTIPVMLKAQQDGVTFRSGTR